MTESRFVFYARDRYFRPRRLTAQSVTPNSPRRELRHFVLVSLFGASFERPDSPKRVGAILDTSDLRATFAPRRLAPRSRLRAVYRNANCAGLGQAQTEVSWQVNVFLGQPTHVWQVSVLGKDATIAPPATLAISQVREGADRFAIQLQRSLGSEFHCGTLLAVDAANGRFSGARASRSPSVSSEGAAPVLQRNYAAPPLTVSASFLRPLLPADVTTCRQALPRLLRRG